MEEPERTGSQKVRRGKLAFAGVCVCVLGGGLVARGVGVLVEIERYSLPAPLPFISDSIGLGHLEKSDRWRVYLQEGAGSVWQNDGDGGGDCYYGGENGILAPSLPELSSCSLCPPLRPPPPFGYRWTWLFDTRLS